MIIDRDLTLDHMTLADPTLTHQVIIFKPNQGFDIEVTCNCLAHIKSPGGISHYSMGKTTTLDETRALYNDPTNHRKPFTKEDEARW